mmetsp:Transcript_8346/g.12853  ORF Transcript_8346/g.12853 Transcript_8346/m.12853 type:complete len:504 (+) Transcript_8346:82-1593(+)
MFQQHEQKDETGSLASGQDTKEGDEKSVETEQRKIELEERLLDLQLKRLDIEQKRVELELRKAKLRDGKESNQPSARKQSTGSTTLENATTARPFPPPKNKKKYEVISPMSYSDDSGEEDNVLDLYEGSSSSSSNPTSLGKFFSAEKKTRIIENGSHGSFPSRAYSLNSPQDASLKKSDLSAASKNLMQQSIEGKKRRKKSIYRSNSYAAVSLDAMRPQCLVDDPEDSDHSTPTERMTGNSMKAKRRIRSSSLSRVADIAKENNRNFNTNITHQDTRSRNKIRPSKHLPPFPTHSKNFKQYQNEISYIERNRRVKQQGRSSSAPRRLEDSKTLQVFHDKQNIAQTVSNLINLLRPEVNEVNDLFDSACTQEGEGKIGGMARRPKSTRASNSSSPCQHRDEYAIMESNSKAKKNKKKKKRRDRKVDTPGTLGENSLGVMQPSRQNSARNLANLIDDLCPEVEPNESCRIFNKPFAVFNPALRASIEAEKKSINEDAKKMTEFET